MERWLENGDKWAYYKISNKKQAYRNLPKKKSTPNSKPTPPHHAQTSLNSKQRSTNCDFSIIRENWITRHGEFTMAGNIVKWWKHKILGGYKQFSGKRIY